MSSYLYQNTKVDALERLQRLEAIEDAHTISVLKTLPSLSGFRCLELGAGAGSIAEWLANQAGPLGRVLATDLEPVHLDRSKYEVLGHDVEHDQLPAGAFDLAHFRHLLIHLSDPEAVVRKVRSSLKSGGYLIAEESDLSSLMPLSKHLWSTFDSGVQSFFELYEARGMKISIGAGLATLLTEAGFEVSYQSQTRREVVGGSAEAIYQGISVRQLADSVADDCPELAEKLMTFSQCFGDPQLRYQSRTTISVVARRSRPFV